MNNNTNIELKTIKKKYSEDMMHLCRKLFPTLLDKYPGKLLEILNNTFDNTKFLCKDIVSNNLEASFKNYIYSFISETDNYETKADLNPYDLLRTVSYSLYKCESLDDIQEFSKYYFAPERLCSFDDSTRLDMCYVYFAVADGAEDLKREDFLNPERQDEYGRSVISIQFTKDSDCDLSIKNRYNHSVMNPDATFSNNLDNIVPGLTDSFARFEGLKERKKVSSNAFTIPGYVKASDGKMYKYNCLIGDVYYCTDNIIIDGGVIKKYPKEQVLISDYFIIDYSKGDISLYDNKINDGLINLITAVESIKKEKDNDDSLFTITSKNGNISYIRVNSMGQIVSFKNENVTEIDNKFLYFCQYVKDVDIKNVTSIGNDFMHENLYLQDINLPKVRLIGDEFLISNNVIKKIDFPELEQVGDCFFYDNLYIDSINTPKLKVIKDFFLASNMYLDYLNLPNVESIGLSFLIHNNILKKIDVPLLKDIDSEFLLYNEDMISISLPSVINIANDFMKNSFELKKFYAPNVESIGNKFLYSDNAIKSIDLPNVKSVGDEFLYYNNRKLAVSLPKCESIGDKALYSNSFVREISLPNLESIGNYFLYFDLYLEKIDAPKLKKISGYDIFEKNYLSQYLNIDEAGKGAR